MRRLFIMILTGLCLVPFPVLAANRAALVLRKGTGEYKTACVSFDEQTISGYRALELANWSPLLDNGFVVSIDNERAKANYEPGSQEDYWSYWQIKNSTWRYAAVGAQSSSISDGAVEGWQRGTSDLKLNLFSFVDICTISQSVDSTIASNNSPSDIPPPTPAESTIVSTTPANSPSTSDISSPKTPIETTPGLESSVQDIVHHKNLPYIIACVAVGIVIIIITIQLVRHQHHNKS